MDYTARQIRAFDAAAQRAEARARADRIEDTALAFSGGEGLGRLLRQLRGG